MIFLLTRATHVLPKSSSVRHSLTYFDRFLRIYRQHNKLQYLNAFINAAAQLFDRSTKTTTVLGISTINWTKFRKDFIDFCSGAGTKFDDVVGRSTKNLRLKCRQSISIWRFPLSRMHLDYGRFMAVSPLHFDDKLRHEHSNRNGTNANQTETFSSKMHSIWLCNECAHLFCRYIMSSAAEGKQLHKALPNESIRCCDAPMLRSASV